MNTYQSQQDNLNAEVKGLGIFLFILIAHVKTSLMGASVTIPLTNGKLNIGTWQGIWLCEHRDHASSRKIVVTLQGIQK